MMYIKKSKGPRTESCGTPQVIVVSGDSSPSIDVSCILFVRCDLNQSRAIPLTP